MIRVFLTCLALLALASPSRAATVMACQDSDGSDWSVSPQHPCPTVQAGSTGTDFSANAATIPMSGFSLLATIPATPGRAGVEIQNQSAGTLQVVRDDGAGANQTTILLGPGAGVGTQGGGWSSNTFKGRIRVYGAAGSQVSADQE